MKIAVHAKALSEKQPTGIGIYVYNLLKSLSMIDRKNSYTLYSNEPFDKHVTSGNFTEKVLKISRLWTYLSLPLELKRNKHDILFVPKEVVPPFTGTKTVVACFDMGYETDRIFFDRGIKFDARFHIWQAINYALKASDKIIAISESTKDDIVKKSRLAPDKVKVIYLAYDKNLYKPCSDDKIREGLEKYGIKGRYVINLSSTLWYRKNLIGLLKAFKVVKSRKVEGLKLVITGKKGIAKGENKLSRLIDEMGLNDDVLFTGYVDIADLPVLLNGADAMVFPSFHEGFGLPLVEAMGCGCPVITSNISAMPEVVGNAGMLVDPYSENDIASAIEKVYTDDVLRETLKKKSLKRAEAFSWEKTARETLKVFESLG